MPPSISSSRRANGKPRSSVRMAGRYPGVSQKGFSPRQKTSIILLAREAYARQLPLAPFDDWRRAEQLSAIGIASLRLCTQGDYNPLKKHFAALANDGAREFEATYREPDERLRQARHLLERSCQERGVDKSYAESICLDQCRKRLEEAEADDLFRVKFTVEARRSKLRRQAEASCEEPF